MTQKFLFLALAASYACSEDFDPTAPGKRPFAVFGVFDATQDTQFVRVYDTNAPTEPLGSFRSLESVSVSTEGPGGIRAFSDTSIHILQSDGGVDSMTIYQAAGFRPQRGGTYRLTANTSEGIAEAQCVVPGVAILSSNDYLVLQYPYDREDGRVIDIQMTLSSEATGYVVRLVLLYDVQVNGQWVPKESEVPERVLERTIDYKLIRAEYPRLVRRSRIQTDNYGFLNISYQTLLRSLYKQYLRRDIRFKNAIFVVTQAEEHFFNFYGIANGFQDPNSIRVDKPDYSNVNGALGVFGAIANDTLAFDLPADLYPRGF